jgi:hypothetical protein
VKAYRNLWLKIAPPGLTPGGHRALIPGEI